MPEDFTNFTNLLIDREYISTYILSSQRFKANLTIHFQNAGCGLPRTAERRPMPA